MSERRDDAGRPSEDEVEVGHFTVARWGNHVKIYHGATLCWDGIRGDPFLAAITGLRLGLPLASDE